MASVPSILTHREEIILTLNDHWMVLLRPFLSYVSGFIFFTVIMIASFLLFDEAQIFAFILIIIAIIGFLLIHHFLFLYIFHWQLSDLIVTTMRLIELNIMPYVKNDSLIVDLHQISEIKKIRHGILQNIFNYGTLILLIFGATKEIKFYHVRTPSKLVNFLEAYKNNVLAGYTPEQLKELYESKEKFM